MNDVEREIASKLRAFMRSIVDCRTIYTDKRRFQNLVRIKFFGYECSYDRDTLFKKCEEIAHILYQENGAYFLKPVIEQRLYQTYRAEYMIPCIIFFFNV